MKISEIIQDAIGAMTLGQKLLVAFAIVTIVGGLIFFPSMLNRYQVRKLEKEVNAAKDDANRWEELANKRELEAAQYKAKTEYLENSLGQIQTIARTQDENLEKLISVTAGARADSRRAAGIRTISSNINELCRSLAETGHPCE